MSTCVKYREHPQEAYTNWLLEYGDLFGTYSVHTYPWYTTPNRERTIRHGNRFGILLNESIFGKGCELRRAGLIRVFSVEVRGERFHLNYLLGKHPSLIPERIRYYWGKTIGSKVDKLDSVLVTTKPVYEPRGILRYILKEASWEHGPEVYIPKASLRAVEKQ